MEIKNLYPFVLLMVLIAMLLGVGLITLENFGKYARTSTTVTNEQIIASNLTCVQLAQNYITTEGARITNSSSGTDITSCFTWDKTGKFNGDCLTLDETVSATCNLYNASTVNVSYAFGATSSATTASTNVSTELGGIGTNWFGLIITIAILSIIIALVVQSFAMRR